METYNSQNLLNERYHLFNLQLNTTLTSFFASKKSISPLRARNRTKMKQLGKGHIIYKETIYRAKSEYLGTKMKNILKCWA